MDKTTKTILVCMALGLGVWIIVKLIEDLEARQAAIVYGYAEDNKDANETIVQSKVERTRTKRDRTNDNEFWQDPDGC